MEKYWIKPHYSTIIHSPDMVELRYGVWNNTSHVITDEKKEGVLGDIIMGITKSQNQYEIAKDLGIKQHKIESVIDHLCQLGVMQTQQESYIESYLSELAPTLRRESISHENLVLPVVLLGDSDLSQRMMTQLKSLSFDNVSVSEDLWRDIEEFPIENLYDALESERFLRNFKILKNSFVIFTARHIHPMFAKKINFIAHALNISWLHLAIDGPFILIGPTFQGAHGPCYDCFELRVSMNLREGEGYQRYKTAIANKKVYHHGNDPLFSICANVLIAHGVLETLNFITTRRNFTGNKVLTIFLPTMEFAYHEILRLPACPTCGSTSYRDGNQTYFDFQALLNGEPQ